MKKADNEVVLIVQWYQGILDQILLQVYLIYILFFFHLPKTLFCSLKLL
jgi:hypothetical protein